MPSSEIFPVPFDCKTWQNVDGIQHVTVVSEAWLEQQDQIYEQVNGRPPAEPMARMAKRQTSAMSLDMPIYGGLFSSTGSMDSKVAVVITTWMKESDKAPGGEYVFMVEDKIFRYRGGIDDNGGSLALFNGKLPLEPVDYTKQPESFWPKGYCEDQIAPQISLNRQMTTLEVASEEGKGVTFYDTDAIESEDIGTSPVNGFVPFRGTSIHSRQQRPAWRLPPQPVGQEVGSVIGIMQANSDFAAGYRSGITLGQSEGRIEGGPAVAQLAAAGNAPITPVLKRITRAWGNMYPQIADMINEIWPPGKLVRTAGNNNRGREFDFQKMEVQPSLSAIYRPTPMLAGGTDALLNMLFQMRSMPGDDGTQLIKEGELRRSIRKLGMMPPGLEEERSPVARYMERVNKLIGNFETPAIAPADPTRGNEDLQSLENARVAFEILRDTILDDSFQMYGPAVQKALMQELQYFFGQLTSTQPDTFNTGIQDFDAEGMEQFLSNAESDPLTPQGLFVGA